MLFSTVKYIKSLLVTVGIFIGFLLLLGFVALLIGFVALLIGCVTLLLSFSPSSFLAFLVVIFIGITWYGIHGIINS